MIASSPNVRRGAGGIAAVIMLVFVQLLIVGAILTGTRDSSMSKVRLDTTQAFYATESGMNMSVREVIRNVDEDLDGGVGTISNDGNANNDPTLLGARFAVEGAVAGTDRTFTSNGRAGLARRKSSTIVDGVTDTLAQTVMAGFGRDSNNQPRYSTWNGTSWTTSSALSTVNAEPKWVRMKICPTRNETCMIIETEADRVYVFFYNGTTWGTPYLLSSDTGGTYDRPEDLAYEQLSSQAVCVYWKGTSGTFGYRRYNGITFLPEQTISSPFTTEADFVSLYPRPASNQIVLLTADGIAGSKLSASLWNGGTWGAWSTMTATLETNNEECYSMAFESLSGRGMAVYFELLQAAPRYRTLTGTTWSSQSTMPTVGATGRWLRVAASPTSNDILFAALDSSNDLNVNRWNGSAWGTNTELEANCVASDRRTFDIIYERSTGKGLLVYSESGVNAFRYRTWNGSTWSSEMSGPNLGSVPQIITLARGIGNSEVVVACSDASRRLHLVRWNGTSMSTNTIIENTLSGSAAYYSFAVPEPSVAPYQPRVESFTEVMP
jgi:hypothetical protein